MLVIENAAFSMVIAVVYLVLYGVEMNVDYDMKAYGQLEVGCMMDI